MPGRPGSHGDRTLDQYAEIARHFQTTLEQVALSVDGMAPPLQRLAEIATRTLVSGNTVLCCGLGADRALARYVADRLMMGAGEERPALPAVACGDYADGGMLWREARALARPGDLLLCLDTGDGSCVAGAWTTARGRELAVAAIAHAGISGEAPAGIDSATLYLPAAPRDQLLTLEAVVLGCFCHLIDINLFGS